jgi:hypothetical protein
VKQGPDPSRPSKAHIFWRLSGELLVIVAGVLIALAADRWNQDRGLAESRQLYVRRLAEEIRNDSLEAAVLLSQVPQAREASRTLLRAASGDGPLPEPLQRHILTALLRLNWPPVVAWTELNNTGLLGLVDDPDLRESISEYYGVRGIVQDALERAEARSRDPLLDELYPLGLFDFDITPEDRETFVSADQLEPLLMALAGQFQVMENFIPQLLESAGLTLQRLEHAAE